MLIVATFSMAIATSALAQGVGASGTPGTTSRANAENTQRATQAQQLFGEYLAKHRNRGIEARKVLDVIAMNRLPPSAKNVKAIREVLASSVTAEEIVGLARILASQYTLDDKTGSNAAITQDLRGLVRHPRKEVALAAMLSYSRLGYFADTEDLLLQAKVAGVIDDDGYYGELAHLLPYAPSHAQSKMLSKIAAGKNQYATELLATLPENPQVMKRIYPETKHLLLTYLLQNEPGFGIETGVFGMIESIRYAIWLHAVATIRSETSNNKYADVVLGYLNDPKIDARKIMAFLTSTKGKLLIATLAQPQLFEKARTSVVTYSKQYPQNEMMREAVQDITTTLDASKRS